MAMTATYNKALARPVKPNAMIIQGACYSGVETSEGSTWFEVVDYDSNCPAIYWWGNTDYRGMVGSQEAWHSNVRHAGQTFPPQKKEGCPQQLFDAIKEYFNQPAKWGD